MNDCEAFDVFQGESEEELFAPGQSHVPTACIPHTTIGNHS